MKRVVQKVLLCFNIAIILLLLVLSGSMIYFRSSSQPSFMGYSAVLLEQHHKNQEQPTYKLVIIQQTKALEKGDIVLYYHNDNTKPVASIDTIAHIEQKNITLENESISKTISSIDGKVVLQSVGTGRFLTFVINNLSTAFFAIIGGFVLLSVFSIFIIMLLHRKQINSKNENQIEAITVDNLPQEKADAPKSRQVLVPQPLVQTKRTKETPLHQAAITYDFSKPPKNIGTSTLANDVTTEKPPQSIIPKEKNDQPLSEEELLALDFQQHIKRITHEFDTVEELYEFYHANDDVVIENQTQTDEILVPATNSQAPQQPMESVEENSDDVSIDILLDEIMRQAQENFFKEYMDNSLEEYMTK